MKRVLLIGAGRAHAVVLRELARQPLLGARIDFVAPSGVELYCAMVPGVVAGHYARAEAEIDFRSLAERAYCEFIEGEVNRLDADRRAARLSDGRELHYDIVSLNIGASIDASAPGAQLALPAWPFPTLLDRLGTPRRVAIAGGAAAGAELAMALRFRGAEAVTLYSDPPAFAQPFARRVERVLRRASVDYRPGMALEAIEPGLIVRSGATRQEFDLVILASRARPSSWLLEASSRAEVFAADDSDARQGEALHRNLVAAVTGAPRVEYRPRPRALSILTCGARYALAMWGDWAVEGRSVWHWKDRTDRRWMASLKPSR